MRSAANEVLIRRFFLGDLSEEDRDRIEDEYLADPERFEEFLAAENDLVDAYVRGELTKDETRKFETSYLGTPERHKKVEFARALNRAAAKANKILPTRRVSLRRLLWDALSHKQEFPQWALATSMVGLVAIASLLFVHDRNLRAGLQLAQMRQAELQDEEDALRRHIGDGEGAPVSSHNGDYQHSGNANAAKQGESLLALSLMPGGVRGAGASLPSLHLPHLQLALFFEQDNYKTYRAELQTADGEKVLQSAALRSQIQSGKILISWRIPAGVVQPGDYIVQLKGLNRQGGLENVQSYSFRALAQ